MSWKILGCGHYLPKRVVSNIDLQKFVDTTDEWIVSRTGISQRHIARDDEYTSHLAFEAATQAIADSKIDKSEIDLIIVCTTTPDNSFPSVATKLQGYLELGCTPSFDLQAVCAGFIYGIEVADSLIKSGRYNTVLLVGAEKMSSVLDWSDRSTCVLFGDGAGAVIMQRDHSNSGIIDIKTFSDGKCYDILYTDGGVSTNGQSGKVKMKGPELYKYAIEKMGESVSEILKQNDLSPEDITYFIPHQANIRIINSLAERLKFDHNKVVKTVSKHANCSAASIPLALADLKSSKKLKKGDIILFTAFGAGLTWGSALLKW
jgi:3-oxoacyl-[acyl-carrier-protein] synthase III